MVDDIFGGVEDIEATIAEIKKEEGDNLPPTQDSGEKEPAEPRATVGAGQEATQQEPAPDDGGREEAPTPSSKEEDSAELAEIAPLLEKFKIPPEKVKEDKTIQTLLLSYREAEKRMHAASQEAAELRKFMEQVMAKQTQETEGGDGRPEGMSQEDYEAVVEAMLSKPDEGVKLLLEKVIKPNLLPEVKEELKKELYREQVQSLPPEQRLVQKVASSINELPPEYVGKLESDRERYEQAFDVLVSKFGADRLEAMLANTPEPPAKTVMDMIDMMIPPAKDKAKQIRQEEKKQVPPIQESQGTPQPAPPEPEEDVDKVVERVSKILGIGGDIFS